MASSSGTKDDFGPQRTLSRRMTRASTMIDPTEDDSVPIDGELVPSSLAVIVPILRVANEVEKENPRVAYVVFMHLRKLIRRIQLQVDVVFVNSRPIFCIDWRRNSQTLIQCLRQLIQRKYRNFTRTSVRRTLVRINTQRHQDYAKEVERNKEQYEHYNILPLSAVGVKLAIVELPVIKAAIRAIRNLDNLPILQISSALNTQDDSSEYRDKSINDIFHWLASIYGFQKGNVANQREHLVLMLANMDVRARRSEEYEALDIHTIHQLKEKVFENYELWCDYVHCESNLRSPSGVDIPQVDLLYILSSYLG